MLSRLREIAVAAATAGVAVVCVRHFAKAGGLTIEPRIALSVGVGAAVYVSTLTLIAPRMARQLFGMVRGLGTSVCASAADEFADSAALGLSRMRHPGASSPEAIAESATSELADQEAPGPRIEPEAMNAPDLTREGPEHLTLPSPVVARIARQPSTSRRYVRSAILLSRRS